MSTADQLIPVRERVAQDLLATFDRMEELVIKAEGIGLAVEWQESEGPVMLDIYEDVRYYWPRETALMFDDEPDSPTRFDRQDPDLQASRERVSSSLVELSERLAELLSEAHNHDLEVELVSGIDPSTPWHVYIWERVYWPRSVQREYETDRTAFNRRHEDDWTIQANILTGKKPGRAR